MWLMKWLLLFSFLLTISWARMPGEMGNGGGMDQWNKDAEQRQKDWNAGIEADRQRTNQEMQQSHAEFNARYEEAETTATWIIVVAIVVPLVILILIGVGIGVGIYCSMKKKKFGGGGGVVIQQPPPPPPPPPQPAGPGGFTVNANMQL